MNVGKLFICMKKSNGENGEEGIYLHIFEMRGLGRMNRSCGVSKGEERE